MSDDQELEWPEAMWTTNEEQMTNELDKRELKRNIKAVLEAVATTPDEVSSVKMGRELVECFGYSPANLAAITVCDRVRDFGSGSATDAFTVALHTGLNRTVGQETKSRELRDRSGFDPVSFEQGYSEESPFNTDLLDMVRPDGSVTFSVRRETVYWEPSLVVTTDRWLAASVIVFDEVLPNHGTTNADLWAAGIGGLNRAAYLNAIEAAGFEEGVLRKKPQYDSRIGQNQNACTKYGVQSASLMARKW